MYDDLIKGKYHKEYYKKHHTLPNIFDSLGRRSFEEREKVLKEALEHDKTWQEYTGQIHNDLE